MTSIAARVFAVIAALAAAVAMAPAQDVSLDDVRRVAAYAADWELLDRPVSGADSTRLRAAVADARRDFGGRGPALARYFLTHTHPPPQNIAFFFLLHAVGDLPTVRVLADALIDPPIPEGSVIGRDPYELASHSKRSYKIPRFAPIRVGSRSSMPC